MHVDFRYLSFNDDRLDFIDPINRYECRKLVFVCSETVVLIAYTLYLDLKGIFFRKIQYFGLRNPRLRIRSTKSSWAKGLLVISSLKVHLICWSLIVIMTIKYL